MTRKELRERARKQLDGNWGDLILANLVFAIIIGVTESLLVGIILYGSMMVGFAIYNVRFVRFGEKKLESLFSGFSDFGSTFVLGLLHQLFVFLWSLLLVVPGIIMSYAYSACYYIKQACPEMDALDCLNKSKEIMKGHKWELFVLELSFIGWGILCIFTFGIGYFWLAPYINVTKANYFVDLLRKEGIMENPDENKNSEDEIVVDLPEGSKE